MAARKTTPLIVGTLLGLLLCIVSSGGAQANYELITNTNISQSGMVTPYCGMGCWYNSDARVHILATSYAGYIFENWSGDCSGNNPSAMVSMTAAKTCTANFASCVDQPVKRGGSGFPTISSAYGGAGNGDIIGLLATNLYGDLLFDHSVNFTLKGGHNCGYGTNASMSLIQGSLVIAKGTVTIENLMIVSVPAAPPIPNLPPSNLFDYIRIVSTGGTQIEFGTTGEDLIAEYGDAATASQYADAGASADWILQVGGQKTTDHTVRAGDGEDTLYQYGGTEPGTIYAESGAGAKTFFQVGGKAANMLIVLAASGTAHIEQYGGPAGNMMEVRGSTGDDDALMAGGPGDDTITYHVTAGDDIVRIYGNGGIDSLTINKNLQSFTLNDGETGEVLFTVGSGGTSITVYGVGHIHVIGDDGNVIFTRTVTPAPPHIPSLPPAAGFNYVKVDTFTTGDITQTEFGTPGKDLIAEYGCTGNAAQYAEGGEDNDWILQVGGGGSTDQTTLGGDGNNVIHQYGGEGDGTQYAESGNGAATFIQVGSQGANTMEIHGGTGTAHIEQYGGPVGNTMKITGSLGDDIIMMAGGPGDDGMIYTVSGGLDTVRIYGDDGDDTLTINKNQKSFTLNDGDTGYVLFTVGTGGSSITVYVVEHILVIGDDASVIYQR